MTDTPPDWETLDVDLPGMWEHADFGGGLADSSDEAAPVQVVDNGPDVARSR